MYHIAMTLIKLLIGALIIGIGYETNDKYSILLVFQGLFIINYSILSMLKNKSINML